MELKYFFKLSILKIVLFLVLPVFYVTHVMECFIAPCPSSTGFIPLILALPLGVEPLIMVIGVVVSYLLACSYSAYRNRSPGNGLKAAEAIGIIVSLTMLLAGALVASGQGALGIITQPGLLANLIVIIGVIDLAGFLLLLKMRRSGFFVSIGATIAMLIVSLLAWPESFVYTWILFFIFLVLGELAAGRKSFS